MVMMILLFFPWILFVQILAIRAQVEELTIDEESLAYLGEIGQQASLRSDALLFLYLDPF